MSDTKSIESLVLEKFSFLQDEFGMGKAILNRDTWNTTVSYLAKEIGIEIELDWRDLDVFILITRLDNGKLPKGYYVVNGKTCRVHLEEVLKNNLNVDKTVIQDLIQSGQKKKRKRNQEAMIERMTSYQQLVQKYAGAILEGNLFQ
jgi:hypothetical protein